MFRFFLIDVDVITPSNFTEVLVAIIPLLNLLLVIYFFISTRRYSVNIRRAEKQTIWYRELIIQPNLEIINIFFDEYYKIIEQSIVELSKTAEDFFTDEYSQKILRKIIHQCNIRSNDFGKEFIDIVSAFDEEFGQEIYINLDLLQDNLSISLSECQDLKTLKKTDFKKIIRENRIELYKKLYKYNFNFK
jgi:hypothetical protein